MKQVAKFFVLIGVMIPSLINVADAQVGCGIINTIAGDGGMGYSGDGGAATSAELRFPAGVAVDDSSNVYIADQYNNVIRKVNSSGIISTIAGTGTHGYSGDGYAATSAELNFPTGVAVDDNGNVYIVDQLNERIRKVNSSGIISTIAGNGTGGYSGDGGAAISAELSGPEAVAVDASGNIYIAGPYSSVIRKVNSSGIISTFAGNGTSGYSGDGGAATSAELFNPTGVAVDASGNVYIADNGDNRIRKVNSSGVISTFAGNGLAGYSGDGGVAIAAKIEYPTAVAVDASGNVYIIDGGNGRIRKINASGIISTIAGNGTSGYSGDGGAATSAEFNFNATDGLAVDASGNVYIADYYNERIRKVGGCSVSIGAITGATFLCTGTTATLSDASTGGTWSSSNSAIATISTAGVVTGIAAGGDTISYTASAVVTTYTGVATYTITVNAIPSISAGAASSICAGSTATLTVTGGTTYSWSPATGLSVATGASITAIPTITTTYTVTGTTAGCSDTASETIAVNAIPTISAGSAYTICSGSTATLTATGGTTYVWSPATGLSVTTGASIAAIPTVTTTYTVTGTTTGCSNTASETITVNAIPIISAGAASAICTGSMATLTATGGTTYVWSPATGLSATTGTSITAIPAVTTTYTVTGTTAGCSDTASETITVNATIPTITAGTASVICVGSTATLTATGGTTYVWLPATGLSATTGTSITAMPGVTTTYTVTGTTAGCSNTASETVTVNPLANSGTISGVDAVCKGDSVLLAETITGGLWNTTILLS